MKLTNSFFTEILRMSIRVHVALAVSLTLTLSGCLPKDDSASEKGGGEGDPSVQYGGFSGALTVQTVGATRVKISWASSNDSRVVAYNVYDATARFNPRLLRTVNAPANEVTLSGLANQAFYTFRVRATNADNVEDTNVKDLPAIPYAGVTSAQVTSSTSATLTFPDGSNADQVNVYCKSATDTDWAQSATLRNTSATTVPLTGLTPAVEYTCRVALDINGFVDNNLATAVFTPMGEATQMLFTTQPGNGAAGQALSAQPVITIKDANGNTVSGGPDATALVTLVIATTSPTAGTIRGTAIVAAVGGVATFTGINLQESGTKILSATKEDTSARVFGTAPLSVDSNSFTVTPGPVSALTSTIAISPAVPPAAVLTANGSDAYQVVITLRDQYNNPVSGTRPNFSSNIVGDSLTQPTANTNISGEATGSISSTVADSMPPYRQLSISSPSGLSSVQTLAPFKPGPASKLAFSVQPVNSPAGTQGMAPLQVSVQDAQGNRVIADAAASSDISLSIASNTNGAILSGTIMQTAAAGMAAFNDLGIDRTGTGYRLIASSGSFTPAYSNTFNITAGVPRKVSITGPLAVVSGVCSTAITVQLQDNGNNPANAIQNTPITLSGLGSASIYSSSTCGGMALSPTLTYTAGSNSKTIYLKDNKAEALTIMGADSSSVLTTGTMELKSTPSKISLLAQAAPPASAGTPLSVVANQCSTELVLTPMGENGAAGPIFSNTPMALTGLVGSPATIYSDAACLTPLDPMNVNLPVSIAPNYTTKIYLKNPKAESLLLSVSDPGGVMATTNAPQSVHITASNINFAGPTSVVAGQCSPAFTIQLRDAQTTPWSPSVDTALNIDGIPASSVGRFYTSASCSGAGSRTTLTFPQSTNSLQVYFKSTASDSLSISISDPLAKMATSQVINLNISPSALRITAPAGGSSATNVCAGPFKVETLDSVGSTTNAIANIVVSLTGAGTSGAFYSDSDCTLSETSLTITSGTSLKNFYFMGLFPEASLSFSATDTGSVLTAGSAAWMVSAAKSWIGTASKYKDALGNLLWFRTGTKPVAARYDGARSVWRLRFDPTRRYLYVADYSAHRILKYDYQNQTYVGWIGTFWNNGGIGVSGSSLSTPSNAQCVATVTVTTVPGWCIGGQSIAANSGTGGLYNPMDMTDDGTYLYVVNYGNHSVNRYNATTGAAAGWLGWVGTQPTGAATGGPGTCSSTAPGNPTPGWCTGGVPTGAGTYYVGDGRMMNPTAVAFDATYLYVGTRGALLRFNKSTGAFAGWIGSVASTPTSGAAGCSSAGVGTITPGWCFGGSYAEANPRGTPSGGFYFPRSVNIIGSEIWVTHSEYNSVIAKYNLTSGAFNGLLPSLTYNWVSAFQLDTDGTNFFVADTNRILLMDSSGLINGWIGKVANNTSMSGTGCSTLAINANTPGWCLGGTARAGVDETSFHEARAVVYDGNGHILTGQGSTYPSIKKFNAVTGAYVGTLSLESISPKRWSNNNTLPAEYFGYDDDSMYTPTGIHIDGDHMFLGERSSSRVKKFDRKTGELLGWIGAIASTPTGGMASCLGANPYAASPAWCLGQMFLPDNLWGVAGTVATNTNGVMYRPQGLTSDGTYVYVSDTDLHRISRYRISDGAPQGWIGRISTSPTAGAGGCNGAATDTFTPGWCIGGTSKSGAGDGMMFYPASMVYLGGNIYVVDAGNHRVLSFNASTGSFNGWIGRVATNPSSGCTYSSNGAYVVSTSNWCKGGTSAAAANNDRGGGFYFWSQRGGIGTDGTHLFIANFYNVRIDKYDTDGNYLGGARSRDDVYTANWTTDQTVLSQTGANQCSYPLSVHVDGSNIFGVSAYPCTRIGDTFNLFKMGKSSGQIVGWQGGIDPTSLPNGGDPGCAGATVTTPGWCTGGRTSLGVYMGQYGGAAGQITGDANYLYVSDESSNRVTRVPK